MIDLSPDSDQAAYADAVVTVLRDTLPLESLVADHTTQSGPAAHWPQWAQLGWFRLAAPESLGGSGGTLVEELLAHREFGRHLVTPNVLATSIAVSMAQRAGATDLAEEMMSGTRIASLAIPLVPLQGHPQVDGEILAVDAGPDGLLLTMGDSELVLLDAAGLEPLREARGIDSRTRIVRCAADHVSPRLSVSEPAALLHARVLVSAHAAVAAEESCNRAVEYAKLRQQFGKPIGAQQAVAHHCADMAARARAAWAQVRFAGLAARDERADATLQVESAYLLAVDAALKNAAIAIRVHGGLGFTVGCAVHLYLKRAMLLREFGGGVRGAEERLLAQVSPS